MKKKNWRKKLFWSAGIILLALFLIKKTFYFKKGILEDITSNLTYPILWTCNKITSPFFLVANKIESQKNLLNKIENLENENNLLLTENIELKASISFEKQNQELLDFKKRYELDNSIFAKIIGKNISNDQHYALINRGHIHGIKKNMVAIYKLQIIGRITEVFRWHSKVLMISDKNCKVAVSTNATNASGVCCGTNNIDNLKLCFVSHLSQIVNYDFVLSNGQGLIFPEGFCLGKVSLFKKDGIYYNIDIEPLVNLNNIENCLIVDREKINSF